jgi:exodeoxyribonuclease-5
MTNVFCINTNLPSVEKLVKEVKSNLDNLLNEKQIALLWNKWVELNNSNVDKLPTSDDIKSTYGKLANAGIEDFRNNETLSEKSEILDAIQYYYFEGLFQATGKPTVSREDVIKYQKEIFEQIPEILKESGMEFVANDFENYRKYFEATRLNKFQIPDVDLEVQEGKQKDTIGENSSIYTDNKENCSDEVVYLIASLTTDEKVFGLPKPVNFDQTWNIIQNLLGNSIGDLEFQVEVLQQSNEPFIPQLLQKLGVIDGQISPETKDNTNVRTSFVEAFAKQQQDISITPVGLKNSFSAIDGQEKTSFRDNAKSLFRASKFAHKVNGKTVLNKEEYNKIKFNNTPESLKEFLALFGIDIQGEMTKDIIDNAIVIKDFTNKYLINNELEWLDFQDKALNVSSRVMSIIETQLPYVKKNKNLSVKNAEGKKQSAQSNHNYFSKLFSKLLNKIIKPKSALEKLISNGEVELNLVSGAQTQDRSEAFVFNKLSFTDIVTTTITNMFSSTPIIQLPRTSDKSSERSMKMLFKDKNANMAYTDISNIVLKNLYDSFQSDLNQTFSDKWKYGAKDSFAFWKELGLEEIKDPSGEKYFETFKIKILEYVENQRNDTVDLFEELGVINLAKKQINFTDSAWSKMSGTFEEKLSKTVDNFNFNSLYFGVLYTQMTQGSMSPTTIENMYKRFAGPVAEARTTRADAFKVNYLNEGFKKLGLDKFNAKYLKVYVHGETEEESLDKNLIADIYRKNNVDDAQGIMLLPMYKVTLEMTNQWLPKQEELYQKIMKGEKVNEKEFKSTFPPIKPVGQCVIEIDGAKVPVYIKTAVYPISPLDVQGLENEDKYNHGIANGIGLYIPKSGIKMTTPKKLNPIYNKEGKIDEENTTFNFPMEYFGIQLDINPKTSTKQLIGTQIRKLLTTNLFKQGKAADPKYKEWVDKNIKLYEDLSKIETDKLYEAAGIELIKGEPKIINFNKLKELVTDELLSRNMPINVINSLKYIIDTNGNLNGNTIDSLPARQKIMNLLNAIVTNRLIKLNTNGTALVQISQQGWKMKTIADPTDVNILATETAIDFVSDAAKLNYYKKGGLQFFTKSKRTGEAEILIPAKYKHYVKEDGTFDESLLVNIGYRIPTQGHNSMLHLKVVGYLPAHLDQVVVMPKEITSQGGSDFDVDKINLFIPNSIILDGKTKFISMDMNPEEIFNDKKAGFEKLITYFNQKIEQYYRKLDKADKKGEDYISDEVLELLTNNPELYADLEELEIKNIFNSKNFTVEDYEKIYKKLEKLKTKEGKKEWIQNFKSKQLQNEIITQTVEILEDPIVYAALTNPNNSDDLKADAERVNKNLGSKAKKIKLTYNNLFKGVTLLKTTYQMFAAKALVGVFASQSTHHALAQQVGLHFKSGRKFFFDHNTVEVDGELRISLSNDKSQEYVDLVESEKQGKKVMKRYEISDALGNNKLTAAVDAAKDDYLTSLGINLQTGDVFALGDRIGANPYYMTAWINQPIIQDYLNLTKKANSMTAQTAGNDMNKKKIIQTVLEDYKSNGNENLQYLAEKYENGINANFLFNNREEAGNYTVEQLEDSWFNNKGTKEMALHLLDDFLYFEDAASITRQSISTSKFDTAGPGKDVLESTLLEMKYHDFVNKMNDNFGYTLATITEEQLADELTDRKLHKYELFPKVYANAGQREALDKLKDFLNSNEKQIVLVGRGGTGKTTIIKKILEGLPKSVKIGGITPSHKAKKVLGKSIGKDKVKTVHSALAIKLDENTGKFTPDLFAREQGRIPIRRLDVIIVDEASMVSDALVDEIMLLKKPSAKVIFMGDNAQLPPVGQETDSKVFNLTNKIVLLEKMRQAKTSPIINIGELIANNIESKNPILQAITDSREGKYDTESNSYVDFINNEETLLNDIVDDINKANENPNFIKVVTFNNEKHNSPYSVKNLNDKIREKLWGTEAKNQFNVGEMVTAYDNYTREAGDEDEMQVYNSDDLVVTSVEEDNNFKGSVVAYSKAKGNRFFEYNYNIIYLGLKDDEGKEIVGSVVPVIADSSKAQYEKDLQNLWATDKQLGVKLSQAFANIQYGYAITSHKAQGSTYTNTYVIENNILGTTNGGTILSKNKSLYVAASRPTNKLVIFNPNKNESISDKTKKEFSKTETEQYVPEKEILNVNYQATYANIINNTLLKVFYDKSFNFVGSIYHDLVALHKNTYIEEAVKGLIYPTAMNFVTKPVDSQEASKIYGAVVNYLIQSQIPLNHSLVYGDNTVHHRIIKIQENPNHPLHNNDVIQSFFNVELSGNDGIPSVSAPKNKSITTDEAGAFTRGFEEIQFLEPELYNDLVTIAMYQTGVLQSPTSFYNYLPVQTVIPLVSKAIKDAIPTDSQKIARAVIANIGNKMDNIQRVTAKEGDSLEDGRLILIDPEKAKGKVFIKYTQYIGNESITKLYENVGPYFQEIKPKNHKQLFYDLRDNAEPIEAVGVIDEEIPSDVENPFKEEFVPENISTITANQPSTQLPITSNIKTISKPYGVVVAETNPDKLKTAQFVNIIQPQIKKQAYKENNSSTANDMFMYGLRWTRKGKAIKPLNNKSYANKGLPITDALAKDGYVYDTVDQNGNALAPISDLQPIINEIQNNLNIDMSDYDAVIGNIYLPGQNIATHRDTTESLSAKNYPVVVYTIGNNSGISVYENEKNPGSPSFASNKKITIPTKNGSIYTFGMDGKGRFEVAHDTPKGIKRDQNFPKIMLPNGDIIENYTITLTFRRAADLEPNMPTAPKKIAPENIEIENNSKLEDKELLIIEENEIPKKEGETFAEMQKRVTQNLNIKKRIEIAQKNNIIQGKSYSYFEIKKLFNNDKLFDNEIYKQLDNILQSSNLVFKFGSLNQGKKTTNAYYNSISNSINIDTLVLQTPNLATSDFKRILLHEIIHAATSINLKEDAILTNTQKTALNNLNNLIKELNNDRDFFAQYGLTNANELLAELANESFVGKLKKKTFNDNQSFFDKIISEIVKLLGLKTTAYDIVKESFDNLIKEKLQNVTSQAAWDNLTTEQQEQLKDKVLPEYFNTWSKEKQEAFLECNTK